MGQDTGGEAALLGAVLSIWSNYLRRGHGKGLGPFREAFLTKTVLKPFPVATPLVILLCRRSSPVDVGFEQFQQVPALGSSRLVDDSGRCSQVVTRIWPAK